MFFLKLTVSKHYPEDLIFSRKYYFVGLEDQFLKHEQSK